jgi:hypothetical protein
MSNYRHLIKQNGRRLAILSAIFIIVLLCAAIIGRAAFTSCLWAFLLVVFSGIVSIVPVVRDARLTSTISTRCALLSIAARLFVMLTGTASILLLTRISVLYFVLWLAVLYPPMIVVEILIIMSLIKAGKEI